jgi:hypothetical protein
VPRPVRPGSSGTSIAVDTAVEDVLHDPLLDRWVAFGLADEQQVLVVERGGDRTADPHLAGGERFPHSRFGWSSSWSTVDRVKCQARMTGAQNAGLFGCRNNVATLLTLRMHGWTLSTNSIQHFGLAGLQRPTRVPRPTAVAPFHASPRLEPGSRSHGHARAHVRSHAAAGRAHAGNRGVRERQVADQIVVPLDRPRHRPVQRALPL